MRFSWLTAALLTCGLIALTFSPHVVTGGFALLAAWTLAGAPHALRAMTLAVVVKFLNPVLITFSVESSALFWLVLLVAPLRILPTIKRADARTLAPVWAFSALAAILSIMTSPAVTISLMKILAFVLIISTLVVALRALADEQRARLATWLQTLAIVVVSASALTLLKPQIAFSAVDLKTGVGLRGIFTHPQTLGIFIAPFAAWAASSLVLLRGDAHNWLRLLATAGMWLVMFLTQARTAAIAATLGVVAAVGLRILKGRTLRTQAGATRIFAVLGAATLAVVVTAALTGALGDAISSFLLKRGAQDLEQAFVYSRGLGIVAQWQNFLDQPLTGHGFGVYPGGQFPDGVTEIAGIPISAPVEKGFVPTAVLEETGIFGFLVFCLLVVAMLRAVLRRPDQRWLAIFVTCLALNIGEAILLSPSGNGLLIWLLIGLSITPSSREDGDELHDLPPAVAPSAAQRYPNLLR